jgi:8-oxo-dGTP pyrophosphatase MutT (NUDIX family)
MNSDSNDLKPIVRSVDPDFWIQSAHSATDTCLAYRVDTYGGVIIDSSNLPGSVPEFVKALSCSLNALSIEGFQKAFWIRIPTTVVEFVGVCIKDCGFYIHHAKREYVMMVKWAHPTRPDPIPPPSTHQVGVGCVLDRGDGFILLVKERTGPAAVGQGIWKLPTGLVDPSEDIQDAAIREAREETGLDCAFDSVIAFRHSHGGCPSLGAMSDLFFACLLRPSDVDQPTLLQESEILASMWVHHRDLHEVTKCSEGTAAWELIERVREVISKDSNCIIIGAKLPAWRRKNCNQWIFHPVTPR